MKPWLVSETNYIRSETHPQVKSPEQFPVKIYVQDPSRSLCKESTGSPSDFCPARSKKSRTGDLDHAMLNRPLGSPDAPKKSSMGARDSITSKSQFKGHRGPQGVPVGFPHVSTIFTHGRLMVLEDKMLS